MKTFPENGVIRLETLEAQAETAHDELSAAVERVQRIRTGVDGGNRAFEQSWRSPAKFVRWNAVAARSTSR